MSHSNAPGPAQEDPLSTFFCEDLSGHGSGDVISLESEALPHLRAARLRPGDALAVTDGLGHRWSAELERLDRRVADCRLRDSTDVLPRGTVVLWAPVANKDRSLWLVEKAVELGVREIRWIEWERSRSVADAGRSSGFLERARKRARAAVQQSGRAWVPTLEPATDLAAALSDVDIAGLLADRAGRSVRALIDGYAKRDACVLAVGPEGGVTEQERTLCEGAGFELVSLGDATLRFETAATAMIAAHTAAVAATRHV